MGKSAVSMRLSADQLARMEASRARRVAGPVDPGSGVPADSAGECSRLDCIGSAVRRRRPPPSKGRA